MNDKATKVVQPAKIRELLAQRKGRMKACLDACAGCTLCAESCFLFMKKNQDPKYMPSYKVLKTLGRLYRTGGRVNREELETMQQLLWRNCVLCSRCYCPFGIDIPNMLAFARSVLRSQGIYGIFPHTSGAPEAECSGGDGLPVKGE
jgi:heterodisulfide reductase subunit C